MEELGIPEKNQLPLKIRGQEHLATSGESNVWKVAVLDGKEPEREHAIVLKQSRRLAFASDEEMRASKKFYEFLKNFPTFGNFVPETLYFKARMTGADTETQTPASPPQAFAIQHFLQGRTVDQMSDEELYRDPAVVKQLLELSRAAVTILQATRAQKSFKPDFGTSDTADTNAWRQGNRFGDSRFSTNILVSNEPDEKGRRVFFVDTGVQPEERTDRLRQIVERQFMGRLREFNFNQWTKKLEKILVSQKHEGNETDSA